MKRGNGEVVSIHLEGRMSSRVYGWKNVYNIAGRIGSRFGLQGVLVLSRFVYAGAGAGLVLTFCRVGLRGVLTTCELICLVNAVGCWRREYLS